MEDPMTPSQRIGRWLTETGRWRAGMLALRDETQFPRDVIRIAELSRYTKDDVDGISAAAPGIVDAVGELLPHLGLGKVRVPSDGEVSGFYGVHPEREWDDDEDSGMRWPLYSWTSSNAALPDLSDGPTRGALEDILLEAWPFAVVFYLEGREPEYSYAVQEYHTIDALNPGHDVRGVSRGAAVAAALIVAHEIPEYR